MSKTRGSEVFRVALRSDANRAAPEATTQDLPPSEKEVIPRHWFCVALSKSGQITRNESNSLSGLRALIDTSSVIWIDYWTEDYDKKALPAAAELGFSGTLISSLIGEHISPYQDFDTEMGVQLPSIHVSGFEVNPLPLLILLRKNLVLTIHPLSPDRRFALLRRYSESVLKKISPDSPPEDKVTMLLLRILDENNDRNFEELRKIEERGDALSEGLADPKTPRDKLGIDIYHMKHALITYLNELWKTVHVLHTLRYGDAEIISNDQTLLNRIGLLAEDVNRQIGLGEHLSEVLASGLEVLQTIYNNQLQALNNRLALMMTYLTIIGTAVLVPNTLATMFAVPVFDLTPQDIWWYLPVMVMVTVGSAWLAYWWVKRQGWLPRKME